MFGCGGMCSIVVDQQSVAEAWMCARKVKKGTGGRKGGGQRRNQSHGSSSLVCSFQSGELANT